MNNQKVWLKIAKAYLTPYEERTKEQLYIGNLGLCDNIGRRYGRRMYSRMSAVWLEFHKQERGAPHGFWLPTRDEENHKVGGTNMPLFGIHKPIHDTLRGTFALFMVWAWDDLFEGKDE